MRTDWSLLSIPKPQDANRSHWVQAVFGAGYIGYAADVGANDGGLLSNSNVLESNGWTVLCVEANPDYEPPLSVSRKLSEICACSDHDGEDEDFWVNNAGHPAGYSSLIMHNPGFTHITVPVRRLDGLLEKHEFPRLDYLTVDVEGSELEVLRGAGLERWKPRIIIAEAWTSGATLHLREYLQPFGYDWVDCLEQDQLFARTAE